MESQLEKIEAEVAEMREDLVEMIAALKEGPPNPSVGAVTACIVMSLIAISTAVAAHLRISPMTHEATSTINLERNPTDAELMDARIRERMQQETTE